MHYKDKKNIDIIILLSLLVAILPLPYGYYQLARLVWTFYFGYKAIHNENKGFWIFSAILVNPFLKISLGKELWSIVNLFYAYVIFIQIRNKK